MPANSASPSPAPFHTTYSAGRARFGERDASAVAPGVDEEDVSRLRHRFGGRDASERIRGGSVAAARTGDDVKASCPQTGIAGTGRVATATVCDVGAAVRIGERQPDLVRRVRAEKENAAREHVGAVVVDANERQRRPPCGGSRDPKFHGRRRVVIGIAGDVPLDPDRRDRGVASNRAGCHAVRLRPENGNRSSRGQRDHGGGGQARRKARRTSPSATVRKSRQNADRVLGVRELRATEMPWCASAGLRKSRTRAGAREQTPVGRTMRFYTSSRPRPDL